MTTSKPRVTFMQRDGHTEHHTFTDGETVPVRVDWTPEDARGGLVDEWLDGAADEAHAEVTTRTRFIRDGDSTLGVLLTEEDYLEGRNAQHRINEDAYGHREQAYLPFVHAPNATTDRLIETEVLERVIKNFVQDKKGIELTDDDERTIHYLALAAAIEFRFDPDSRGIVPVMTPNRAADSGVVEYTWSFLYPTPVAGLYLRPEDDFIAGTGYILTAGSGYSLVGGFWERDYADELAVKLGTALPGLDWFRVRGADLTPEIKKTATQIIREHGTWRRDTPIQQDRSER
ncbi:hypothetical protein [Microbacterium sp. Yaish 1]|uniref:hypothetical protein n=1 Tax=Microbacterium sp. Yaish 1 TaxID=2025014 RepID=UPI000B93C018|nr:hypothetical protein [Microbacterium sp. Yaish 1]OYC97229.1 hypothetical protein CI089_01360 [Microbacterium sp. Yaish 1]